MHSGWKQACSFLTNEEKKMLSPRAETQFSSESGEGLKARTQWLLNSSMSSFLSFMNNNGNSRNKQVNLKKKTPKHLIILLYFLFAKKERKKCLLDELYVFLSSLSIMPSSWILHVVLQTRINCIPSGHHINGIQYHIHKESPHRIIHVSLMPRNNLLTPNNVNTAVSSICIMW